MYAEFRRDHADEIADEITVGEVTSAVLVAHSEWWPRVSASLEKAKTRLVESEFEEAVFHAGRALDGFVLNVLVFPLTAALVERFERFMPDGFPIKEKDIFKGVTGLGNSAAFAEYTASLVTRNPEAAERVIREMRSLVREGGDKAVWRQRDRIFHAPVLADEALARDMVDRITHLLLDLVWDLDRLDADEKRKAERKEFSAGRIEMLRALAVLRKRDKDAALRSYEVPLTSYEARNEREEALRSLLSVGYIEAVKVDDDGFPSRYSSDVRYRLTDAGNAYYDERVAPLLPSRLGVDAKHAASPAAAPLDAGAVNGQMRTPEVATGEPTA
jgi:hypothetical protein